MIKPKKRLGQHFLQDENIARKVISSLSGNYTNIIEVGAGTGVLSKYLLKDRFYNPRFFEIDPESVQFLKLNYPDIGNKIIEKDFLKYDLSEFTAPFVIIGNFPYNISSQILFKVIEYRNSIPEVVGMFQKEVAERIASLPGSKKYGILSVLLQAYYNISYLFTVSENVFFPKPKVKSAVLRMIRNDIAHLDCDEELFFKVVKTAFNQRRKTLRNSLKVFLLKENSIVSELLSRRAEQLTVMDFVALAQQVPA